MPTFPCPDLGVVAARLGLTLLLSGLIGLEREFHHRAAGFRTHILVGLGACLVMMLSILVAGEKADPGRIAAQVVTGVGFLGAGTIMRERSHVQGLTTAASVWTTSAIGLAVGMGWYQGACLTTAAIMVVLLLLRLPLKREGDTAERM